MLGMRMQTTVLCLVVYMGSWMGASAVGSKRPGEESAGQLQPKKSRTTDNGTAGPEAPTVPPCDASSLAWWLQAPFWDSIGSLCYYAEDDSQLLDDETTKAASLAYYRAAQLQELGSLVAEREAKATRWIPKGQAGERSSGSTSLVPPAKAKPAASPALQASPARSASSSSCRSEFDSNDEGNQTGLVKSRASSGPPGTDKAANQGKGEEAQAEGSLVTAASAAPVAPLAPVANPVAAADEEAERASHGGASAAAEEHRDGQDSKFRPTDPILPAEEGTVAGHLLEAWKQKAWRKDWRDHASLLRAVVALVRYGGRDRHFKKRIPMAITLSGASLQVWSSLNDITEELNVQASSVLAAIMEQDKTIKVTLLCEHHGAEPVPFAIWIGVGEQPARVGKGGWSSNDPWFSGSSGTHQVAKGEWLERVYNMFVLALTSKMQFTEKAHGAELREFLGLPANKIDDDDDGQDHGVWGPGSPVRGMGSTKWTKVWNVFTPSWPAAGATGQPSAGAVNHAAPGDPLVQTVPDSSLAAAASAGPSAKPEVAPLVAASAPKKATEEGHGRGSVAGSDVGGRTKGTSGNKDKDKAKDKQHGKVQSDRKGKEQDLDHKQQRERKDHKDKKEKDKDKVGRGQRTMVVQ